MQRNALLEIAEMCLKATDDQSRPQELLDAWEAQSAKLARPIDPDAHLSPTEFWYRRLLSDPSVDQLDIQVFEKLYARLKNYSELAEVRGAIGFLLFCRAADRAHRLKSLAQFATSNGRTQEAAAANAAANSYLSDAAVRDAIVRIYDTDKLVSTAESKATLIASGTTSYIVHYAGAANFVLKLIKPTYLNNFTIRSQTGLYRDSVRRAAGSTPVLPEVHSASDTHIIMEFISGRSLGDLIADGTVYGYSPSERMEIIYGIIRSLEALQLPHLDLAPGNIMVEELPPTQKEDRRFRVRLIDIGYNYLLREGLSGVMQRGDVARYSAPELAFSIREGSGKSDLFSLSMIMLDVMLPASFGADVSVQRDKCWSEHPHLAAAIDECLVVNPNDRAHWATGLTLTEMYATFRDRLMLEARIASLTTSRVGMQGAIGGLMGPVRELTRLLGSISELRSLGKGSVGHTHQAIAKARYLITWSVAVNAFLTVCLALCGYELFFKTLALENLIPKEVSLAGIQASLDLALKRAMSLHASADGQATLAGQFMAVIIVLVVSQYYNVIFSPITTRYCEPNTVGWTEYTIRSTPFLIGLLCLFTSLWQPSWWFVTSLIGPLVTAANNLAVFRFCKVVSRTTGQAVGASLASIDVVRFMEEFERWPRGMVYTGLLILLVGLLLRTQMIGEEAFIGLAIAFLCYAGLYHGASTNMSTLVREGIRRFVIASERTNQRK